GRRTANEGQKFNKGGPPRLVRQLRELARDRCCPRQQTPGTGAACRGSSPPSSVAGLSGRQGGRSGKRARRDRAQSRSRRPRRQKSRGGVALESLVGFSEELGRDRQGHGRRLWAHVPHEGRQLLEPIGGSDAGSVPAKQGTNGERMTEVVNARRGRAMRAGDAELWQHLLAADVADRVGADALAAGVEGEQQRGGRAGGPCSEPLVEE